MQTDKRMVHTVQFLKGGEKQRKQTAITLRSRFQVSPLHVFATNRSLTEAAPLSVVLAGRPIAAVESAEVMAGRDPKAIDTWEQPDAVCARPFDGIAVTGGRSAALLPPLSVTAMTLRLR